MMIPLAIILLIRLNSKKTITGKTGNNGAKNIKIIVPLEYLGNSWRAFEIPITSCEINFMLPLSINYFILSNATCWATKVYVPIITLSTWENAELQPLKSGRLTGKHINLKKQQ